MALLKSYSCVLCVISIPYHNQGNIANLMVSSKKSNPSKTHNHPFHPNKPIIPNVSYAKRKLDFLDSNVANATVHIAKTTAFLKTTNARQISSKKEKNKSKNTTKPSLHQK